MTGPSTGLSIIARGLGMGIVRLEDRAVAAGERSCFYLVRGADRDLLVDGGWGLAPLLPALDRDPSKPLVSVATHSHFDHIGALHEVPLRLGHGAEAEIFARPDPHGTQAWPYLRQRPVLAGGGTLDLEEFWIRPCPLTGTLHEGDEIDLGGRVLSVLHTPGHSPGSICLFEEGSGLLWCGDTVHDGLIYDEIPGASRTLLLDSHRRLLGLRIREALPGHGGVLDRNAFRDRIEVHAQSRHGR